MNTLSNYSSSSFQKNEKQLDDVPQRSEKGKDLMEETNTKISRAEDTIYTLKLRLDTMLKEAGEGRVDLDKAIHSKTERKVECPEGRNEEIVSDSSLQRKHAQMQQKIDSLTQINISNEIKIINLCRVNNERAYSNQSSSDDQSDLMINMKDEQAYKRKLLDLNERIVKVQLDYESRIDGLEQRNISLQAANSNLEKQILNQVNESDSDDDDMFDTNLPLTSILNNQTKDPISCPLCVENISDIMELRNKVRSLKKELQDKTKSLQMLDEFKDLSLEETILIQQKTMLQDKLNKALREIASYSSKNEELSQLYENLIKDNTILTKKLIALEERNCERQERMSIEYNVLSEKYLALEKEKQAQSQQSTLNQQLSSQKITDLESLLEKMSQVSIQCEETNRKKITTTENENKKLKMNLSSLQLKYDQVNKLAQTLTQSYGEVKKENALLRNSEVVPKHGTSFLKQVENIWQHKDAVTSSLKSNAGSDELLELKWAYSDLQNKLNEIMEREKKLLSENAVIKGELADTKEALLSEIAIMTDKVNDQDDAVKHYRSQVKELVEENRRLESGYTVNQNGAKKSNYVEVSEISSKELVL